MSTFFSEPRFRIESLSTTLGSLPRLPQWGTVVWVYSWPGVFLCLGFCFQDYTSLGLRWILFGNYIYIYIYIYKYYMYISPHHLIQFCDAWAYWSIPVYLVANLLMLHNFWWEHVGGSVLPSFGPFFELKYRVTLRGFRSHIPPKGKFGKSSSQKMPVHWRVRYNHGYLNSVPPKIGATVIKHLQSSELQKSSLGSFASMMPKFFRSRCFWLELSFKVQPGGWLEAMSPVSIGDC